MLLRENNGILHKFPLGGEVHAVVQLARPRQRAELVTKLANLGIHNQPLWNLNVSDGPLTNLKESGRASTEVNMGQSSNGQTWRVVASTALQTD